jgi:hypothetical protein
MSRPNPYIQLNDPDSDMVRDALARRCIVCKATPQQPCTNIYGASELAGRLVHFARTVE